MDMEQSGFCIFIPMVLYFRSMVFIFLVLSPCRIRNAKIGPKIAQICHSVWYSDESGIQMNPVFRRPKFG